MSLSELLVLAAFVARAELRFPISTSGTVHVHHPNLNRTWLVLLSDWFLSLSPPFLYGFKLMDTIAGLRRRVKA